MVLNVEGTVTHQVHSVDETTTTTTAATFAQVGIHILSHSPSGDDDDDDDREVTEATWGDKVAACQLA